MLTIKQRDILSHSLGIIHHAQESYRSSYYDRPGFDLTTLVELGYMTNSGRSLSQDGCVYFHVTPEGEKACRDALKPVGLLHGWWHPEGARRSHYVDLRRPPARGSHQLPGVLCGGNWCFRPSEVLLSDPLRACSKCDLAIVRFNRKLRQVAHALGELRRG